jgi:hypothetical protein
MTMAEQTESVVARMGIAVQEVPARGSFSPEQVKALLRPINPARVLQANGHSHVSQQDIRAHLIRVFGFGNYDMQVLETECLFEDKGESVKNGDRKTIWTVAYRALVRLTLRNEHGELVAMYEDGSAAEAKNQPSRGDAHDLAYKSAISLSVKRAAIALGDQFGLSLYNKGQEEALVMGTMVGVPREERPEDVQANVPQQVALGNDEADVPLDGTDPAAEYRDAPEAAVDADTGEVRDEAHYLQRIQDPVNASIEGLRGLWEGALQDGVLTQAVKAGILKAKAALDQAPPAPQPPAEAPVETTEPAPAEPAPADEKPAPKPRASRAKKETEA